MSLSIIIASSGRRTLARTVQSVVTQLEPGDELIVDVNDDAPWGHAARNRQLRRARGRHLLFMDDDDVYVPGALRHVRAACAQEPRRIHLFRMRYPGGGELWHEQKVVCGNVSTQMVVVPRRGLRARWGDRYEGDFDFIAAAVGQFGEPVWHETVIAQVRHG